MTKILETAFDKAKTLPEDQQDRLGQWVQDFVAQEQSTLSLSTQQRAEVLRRLNQAKPVFATDEQVRALFDKFAV